MKIRQLAIFLFLFTLQVYPSNEISAQSQQEQGEQDSKKEEKKPKNVTIIAINFQLDQHHYRAPLNSTIEFNLTGLSDQQQQEIARQFKTALKENTITIPTSNSKKKQRTFNVGGQPYFIEYYELSPYKPQPYKVIELSKVDGVITIPCNQNYYIVSENKITELGTPQGMWITKNEKTIEIVQQNIHCGEMIEFKSGDRTYTIFFDPNSASCTNACDDSTCSDCGDSNACGESKDDCGFTKGPSYADYRLTYDLNCNQYSIWERKKVNGCFTWVPYRNEIFRPKLNKMIDVHFLNYNPIRDTLNVNYTFENLHQENQAEFLEGIFVLSDSQKIQNTEQDSSDPKVNFSSPQTNIPCDTLVKFIKNIDGLKSKLTTLVDGLAKSADYAGTLKLNRDQAIDNIQRYFSTIQLNFNADLKMQLGVITKMYDDSTCAISSGLDISTITAFNSSIDEICSLFQKLSIPIGSNSIAPIQLKNFDKMHLEIMRNGKSISAKDYEFNIRGGWKVDFSTGFIGTNLRDFSYFYKQTSSDTTFTIDGSDTTFTYTPVGKIVEDNKNPFQWGVGVMAHFYPRTGTIVNGSISIGMLVQQTNVKAMIGGSLLLGREQRLVLSSGLSWGAVTRLAQELDTETERTIPTGTQSIATRQINQFGLFFGATYNFATARLSR